MNSLLSLFKRLHIFKVKYVLSSDYLKEHEWARPYKDVVFDSDGGWLPYPGGGGQLIYERDVVPLKHNKRLYASGKCPHCGKDILLKRYK